GVGARTRPQRTPVSALVSGCNRRKAGGAHWGSDDLPPSSKTRTRRDHPWSVHVDERRCHEQRLQRGRLRGSRCPRLILRFVFTPILVHHFFSIRTPGIRKLRQALSTPQGKAWAGNLDSIERAHHSGLRQSHSPVSKLLLHRTTSSSHDCTSHITRTRWDGMGYLHDDEPQAAASSLAPLYIRVLGAPPFSVAIFCTLSFDMHTCVHKLDDQHRRTGVLTRYVETSTVMQADRRSVLISEESQGLGLTD
ncbi:hypothetical protein GW17_00018237, partial [Ensete ventricosum]